MVKPGVNQWSFPKSVKLEEAMSEAAKAGFSGFEPAVAVEDLEAGADATAEKFRQIALKARDLGLEIPTVATGLFWRVNPLVEPEKAAKVVEVEAAAAKAAEARVILVVPGTAVSGMGYDEMISRATEWLRRVAKIASREGVEIGVENVWNRFLAGPLELRKLLEEVGLEEVGAYLDVGNTLPHSLPEHWIKELAGRIKAVHIKDFNMQKLDFGIPLTGDVNWEAVRSELEKAGYDWYVTLEIPYYRGDAFKAIYDARDAVRRIFGV